MRINLMKEKLKQGEPVKKAAIHCRITAYA